MTLTTGHMARMWIDLGLVVSIGLFAAAASAQPTTIPRRVRDLAPLTMEFAAAARRGEAAAVFAAITDSAYVFTGRTILGRAERLAGFSQRGATLDSVVVEDLVVHDFRATAVVTYRERVVGTRPDGGSFRTEARWSDVYTQRDGRWWLVAEHASPVDPPRAP
jgi:ketosteroid isomerase-like protein